MPRRASTLPGPTSTKRGAPASCRASTVSRQRTGRVRARRRARRGRPRTAAALAQEKTGKRGLVRSRPRRARRGTAATAGSIARRVERAGDVERQHAAAALAGDLLGLVERVARAGEDDLAGRVVVGDGDAGGLGDRRALVLGRRRRARASCRRRRPRPSAGRAGRRARSASSRSSTPAAASAASSPSEWPAAAHGVAGRARPSRRRLAQKIAGCAKRVFSLDARERILADELDARARAARARAARRGRASRASGSPGRGRAPRVLLRCSHLHHHRRARRRHTLGSALPPAGGCETPRSTRSGRGAGPSAPPRRGCARRACGTARDVCSLTVCGERNSAPAISRLVAPEAIASSTSRSRSDSGGPGGRLVRLEHGHAEPDHAHGAGDVGGRPVLGDEARRRRRRAPRSARCGPAPEISSTLVLRRDRAQPLADLRAGLLADEQVHERDVRLVAARRARAPRAALRALRQRSTHGCSPSISRRPQCTTSWSSTTSTRSLRSLDRRSRSATG